MDSIKSYHKLIMDQYSQFLETGDSVGIEIILDLAATDPELSKHIDSIHQTSLEPKEPKVDSRNRRIDLDVLKMLFLDPYHYLGGTNGTN